MKMVSQLGVTEDECIVFGMNDKFFTSLNKDCDGAPMIRKNLWLTELQLADIKKTLMNICP